MSTKVVIIFPYSGYISESRRANLFWSMVEACRETTNNNPPVVVLNMDTEIKGRAKAFLDDPRSKTDVEIYRVWSVDTCQMWLAGWGYVIDKYKDSSRVVQLPGDIDSIGNKKDFFNGLSTFITFTQPWDIVIGDFSSGDQFNAKDLIDRYGTYSLLANWFPEISKSILELPLNKPRSEFLNINVPTLKSLLEYRKFAYEQTLNMLIRSWDDGKWKYKIHPHVLGTLKDDSSLRQYRDCLDQIERTERMLKLLWREIHEPSESQDFDVYDRLDRRSTSIRESARVILRNLLGVGLE